MMGNALKVEDASLTLQIKGGGPLGTVLTCPDAQGNVRGYVQQPHVDLPLRPDGKLDVGSAVGSDGTLTVIKDLGMKEPYIGSVQLLGGEIAEDLAAYFVESEQIPTACALGVLVDRDQSVKAAGGYIIQLLPGAGEDVIGKVEGGVMAAGAVTALLDQNDDPEALLRTVLSDFELEILETLPRGVPLLLQAGSGWSGPSSAWGRDELESILPGAGGAASSPASSATRSTPSPPKSSRPSSTNSETPGAPPSQGLCPWDSARFLEKSGAKTFGQNCVLPGNETEIFYEG